MVVEYNGGSIEISDSVLKEIVYRNLSEILGINPEDSKAQKRLRKMINVTRTPEDHVIVNIKDLAVPYGEKITDFAKKIMERIKEDIERMTEIPVDAVNVEVTDVVEKERMEETLSSSDEES